MAISIMGLDALSYSHTSQQTGVHIKIDTFTHNGDNESVNCAANLTT